MMKFDIRKHDDKMNFVGYLHTDCVRHLLKNGKGFCIRLLAQCCVHVKNSLFISIILDQYDIIYICTSLQSSMLHNIFLDNE